MVPRASGSVRRSIRVGFVPPVSGARLGQLTYSWCFLFIAMSDSFEYSGHHLVHASEIQDHVMAATPRNAEMSFKIGRVATTRELGSTTRSHRAQGGGVHLTPSSRYHRSVYTFTFSIWKCPYLRYLWSARTDTAGIFDHPVPK